MGCGTSPPCAVSWWLIAAAVGDSSDLDASSLVCKSISIRSPDRRHPPGHPNWRR